MRKRLIAPIRDEGPTAGQKWLDLEQLGVAEISSEDSAHPIEGALLPGNASGWLASEGGQQTIRLLFDQPQRVTRIELRFEEYHAERTQEFVLRWSPDGGRSYRDIVRQQWNFSPHGATVENEDYKVDLPAVTVLELTILPDITGETGLASLAWMRIA